MTRSIVYLLILIALSGSALSHSITLNETPVLKESRTQAIEDMGQCVLHAGQLVAKISAILDAFQWELVPGILRNIYSCYHECQAFRQLDWRGTPAGILWRLSAPI